MKEKERDGFYLWNPSGCPEYLKDAIIYTQICFCAHIIRNSPPRKSYFVSISYLTFQKEEHQHTD